MSVDHRQVLGRLGETPVSGQSLAKQLKVTRAAVWKQIRSLQALGFPIRSHAKLGYSLDVTASFPLLAPQFAPPLSHWAKPHLELSTTSTQILAKRAAHAGVPDGHFWVSEVQTHGRGRLGREWNSGFGGLWWSVILRPQVAPSKAGTVGMLAALTLAETIQAVTGQKAHLKWPNDILLKTPTGWRKVAGFLTEMSGEMGKTEWIVLGIGLNVHNRLPEGLSRLATSLSEQSNKGKKISRETLLEDFFRRFLVSYRLWQREGFERFREAYWKRYFQPGEPVALRTGEGLVRGIARSVDPSGAIIVESRRKNRAILEGDIILS